MIERVIVKEQIAGALTRRGWDEWDAIKGVPQNKTAILPSEMVMFITLCKQMGVNDVVESGRDKGYSTHCLGLSGLSVTSYEINPDAESDKALLSTGVEGLPISLNVGDGSVLIPKFIDQLGKFPAMRVAVLLDGPKGLDAMELYERIQGNIVFCAIHDASRLKQSPEGREANPVREELEKRGAVFSDEFPNIKECDDARWAIEDESEEAMREVAFTLAILPGGRWDAN